MADNVYTEPTASDLWYDAGQVEGGVVVIESHIDHALDTLNALIESKKVEDANLSDMKELSAILTKAQDAVLIIRSDWRTIAEDRADAMKDDIPS